MYTEFVSCKKILELKKTFIMEKQEKYMFIEGIWECIGEACELDSDDSEKEELLLELAEFGERATTLSTKKSKRKWIKEWRKRKESHGSFAFLNKELLPHDQDSYKNYLRLSKDNFDFFLSQIRSDIQRSDTSMRAAISAEEKLAMTLRFLATGESYISLDYQTRLSKASICSIVPEVCNALYTRLKSTHLKFPSSNLEWEAVAKEFTVQWQFPNCIGALDGKHINFRPSRKDGAFYHNYKGSNSIVLLALADANCKFIFVDVRCNGRCNDSGIFLQSKLSNILQEEKDLPEAASIGNDRRLPYVVVGDDAFPLQKHLMKPYPYHSRCPEKQIFNKRLSRARHTMEHAFGILANRFQVFLAPINLEVNKVEIITLACCALHNYLLQMGETFSENAGNTSAESNLHSISFDNPSNNPYNPRKGEAESIRQQFTKYFNEEGKLDWLQQN